MNMTGADQGGGKDRARLLANIPGRYHLEKWSAGSERPTTVFACRIQRISPSNLLLSAPVSGDVGDWVVGQFNEFGRLRGQIERTLGFGFAMSLELDSEARRGMADRIAWLDRHKNYAVTDTRRHSRLLPRDPQSVIVLADASLVPCFVIDMSNSGAAVSAELDISVGMPLAIGTVVGRVVRMLDHGFAVRFIETIATTELEARLIRSPEQLLPDQQRRLHAATRVLTAAGAR